MRCQSYVLVTPQARKRCIRLEGHAEEDHVWVEDRRVVGNQPVVAYWRSGDVSATIYTGVQS